VLRAAAELETTMPIPRPPRPAQPR
jgi:hypothetical protein